MSNYPVYDMVIVGGGPGGYTAALYAVRAGLTTIVLEKLSAGGQMALTNQVDNYPGFEEGIDGFSPFIFCSNSSLFILTAAILSAPFLCLTIVYPVYDFFSVMISHKETRCGFQRFD